MLLKITSLNAVVITVRLIISLIIQRILAVTVGEIGIAKIGQLRNLLQIITSSSSLGTFNGVVKYVSEFKDHNQKLTDLFTTTFIFVFIGAIITSSFVFFNALWITNELFGSLDYVNVIKCLALLPLVIGVNRVFHGIINGLSEYKKYAKIDLLSYILSITLLLICLYYFELEGVLFSIVITPIIQLGVIIYVFGTILKKHIKIKNLAFKIPFAKELLAFMLMSFVSTVLLNYIELDIRTMITNKININEAGYWTAMGFISKNYMVFSSGLFTLYVIPKFARIYEYHLFKKEVLNIYKTILPLFGLGMLLVYLFRNLIIDLVYPNFTGLEPLFRWQLLGDFVRLATLVISHQFLAKKMIKSFVITELISLGLFYFLSKTLVDLYGAEGVVMAHLYRYIIYFGIVVFVVWSNFSGQKQNK
ncbi:O-antigen translocase [Flavivirga jejuensis]|uniref:O-antigen translocase n=1 Tax=Flavivirga jejuensis TaxID=870487 RepID=A0ABT8WKC3_9FLAO|nr:O-antigen translocase [Flavivirga jejuensis]MDO5973563.1 O-antigen translocase [Flavivirga jejuensis]